MAIKTILCKDCICLPVCINKADVSLIEDCCFFKNTLINISADINEGNYVVIYFKYLDRTITVQRSTGPRSAYYVQLITGINHILKWRGL